MKLSGGERLILAMLAEVYKKLDIRGEIDADLVLHAVFGDPWALDWQYGGTGLFEDGPSEEVVNETAKIMTMWRMIEQSYGALNKSEQERVVKAIGPYGEPRFEGFDGNDSAGHYGVATFLVERLGRFEELRDRSLNSHSSGTLSIDRKRLVRYESARDTKKVNVGKMDADTLIEILKP